MAFPGVCRATAVQRRGLRSAVALPGDGEGFPEDDEGDEGDEDDDDLDGNEDFG
jgi:hypothetical protein